MRIVLCVTSDVATDQRVNRIADSLLKLPADLVITGTRFKNSLQVSVDQIQVKRFGMLFRKGPLFYAEYNIKLFFILLFTKADVLVANDLDTLLASYLASRLKRIRLLYDSHEYFTELPELVGRKLVRNIWESIERHILPGISCSYTVSESIAAAYYQKYGIRMEVIRNLPRRIECPVNAASENANERIIIYQGVLNMGRGLENAIRAMQFLNHSKLLIAGSGYHEALLRQLVAELKLEGKVQFLGRLLPEDLFAVTCKAHLGISLEENLGLSYYYALPNKLFDYIQAQIPVLVSELPEMASLVNQYRVGYVIQPGATPRELSTRMETMLTDASLRNSWKKNLEKAASELCWENEEIKLLQIYRRALFDVALPEQEVINPDKKRSINQHNHNIF